MRPRRMCTSLSDSGDEIQRSPPGAAASLPSRLTAHLAITHGRPRRIRHRKGAVSRSASAANSPTSTVMPAALIASMPRPATSGKGSLAATTTRRSPAPDDRLGAGGRLAMMATGLERDEKRAAPGRLARSGDRHRLGVGPAEPVMPAFARSFPRRRGPPPRPSGWARPAPRRGGPVPGPAASAPRSRARVRCHAAGRPELLLFTAAGMATRRRASRACPPPPAGSAAGPPPPAAAPVRHASLGCRHARCRCRPPSTLGHRLQHPPVAAVSAAKLVSIRCLGPHRPAAGRTRSSATSSIPRSP